MIMNPYLVPQPLGRNNGDLITDTLVCLEVKSKLRVVSLDNDLSGLLDGLGSYCSRKTPSALRPIRTSSIDQFAAKPHPEGRKSSQFRLYSHSQIASPTLSPSGCCTAKIFSFSIICTFVSFGRKI